MSLRKRTPSAAFGVLAILVLPSLALAASAKDDRPAGNLLRAARLVDSLDVSGSARFVVDDSVAVEGARWDQTKGVRLENGAASLTFDLGSRMPIEGAYLQADAGNAYSLQISEDGEHFQEIWKVRPGSTKGRGMRSAALTFPETAARFVRFGERTGGGSATVTELHLYASIPVIWPPLLTAVVDSGGAGAARRDRHGPSDRTLGRLKVTLALLGALLLVWGRILVRRGTPRRWQRLRDGLLLALGILGFLGYFNWASYPSPRRVHYHEFYHYFVGAKYFQEVGYTGLYECTSLAEAESGFRRRVEHRVMRNLRTNQRVPATYILDEPERLKGGFTRPFTPERWEEFKRDIAYFRAHLGPARWERALQDHGYNASPVWNVAGSLLANTGPASDRLVGGVLCWIDPALIAIAFVFILWGFGWRVACIAALFFGTNDLSSYFWMGGAYIRQDWMLCAVVGLCLLKRGHAMLGGAGLAVSALLRIFPVGFFVPVVLRLLWILYRERRLDPYGARLLAGAALAAALLVPISTQVAGGAAAWPEFFRNTAKHASTTMTNHVGLRTILTFQWDTRQKVTYDPSLFDPFQTVRETREKVFRGHRALFGVLGLGYLALLLFALRRERDWWVWATFGFGVIPIGLELTSYYYSCLVAAAFLWERRPTIAIGLLLLAALGQVASLGTFFYDIRFYLHSLLVVAFVVWATWDYSRVVRVSEVPVPAQP